VQCFALIATAPPKAGIFFPSRILDQQVELGINLAAQKQI
jgi:hypothetical protein